jgi:hypothetical protein
MKIKQLLMLFVAGTFGFSAAADEQFVSDNEYESYSQQADAQEGLQDLELGEGFSPAKSMQKQNNDDEDMTQSYDGGQSSGEFESAPEVAPEDMPESASNSYGYDGGQSSGELYESVPEAASEDAGPSDMLGVTAEDYRDKDAESSDGSPIDLAI